MSTPTDFLSQPDEDFIDKTPEEHFQIGEEENKEDNLSPVKPEQDGEDQAGTGEPSDDLEEPSDADPIVPSIKPEGEAQEGFQEDSRIESEEEPVEINYADFYKKLTMPFKANGKMIHPTSEEEILRLMQQGANYTKKLQQIAPYRRVIATLEKNGLLDEAKINHLIDLSKQDKNAISKLMKDSKLDPMDMDLDSEEVDQYKPQNHYVSEQEVVFNEILDEIKEQPKGLDILREIHETWDNQSKDILWEQPQTFHVLLEQKQSGLYDYVVSAIENAKALGKVAPGAPFIAVYRDASEDLYKQGKLNRFLKPENQFNPKPVAKTVQKKPSVGNHQKAQAASTGVSTKTAKANDLPNPLALSDDEFLKLMAQQV